MTNPANRRPRMAVSTAGAPAAVGPYSQAVVDGDLVILSGQIPLDPVTGVMVDGDVAVQTRRVLDNIGAVLEAAGTSFDAVLKTTIFLVDMADFTAVNQVYAEYFTGPPPARSTVGVASLPKGARVEIEAIARRR